MRTQREAVEALEAQTEKDGSTIAELRSQLDAAKKSADKAAQAAAATFEAAVRSKSELEARLADTEAKLNELTARLQDTQVESQPQEPAAKVTEPPVEVPSSEPRRKRSGAKPPSSEVADRRDQMDLFGAPSKTERRVSLSELKPHPGDVVADDSRTTQVPEAEAEPPAVLTPVEETNEERTSAEPGGDASDETTGFDQVAALSVEPPSEQASSQTVSELSAAGVLPETKEHKSIPARHLPPPPPVKIAELRQAVHDIVPLLADQDPGARDCLRDNKITFRSAFTSGGYVEFEQLVKSGEFSAALEQLKKAAKKHGISA
jgi:hypothetical protein